MIIFFTKKTHLAFARCVQTVDKVAKARRIKQINIFASLVKGAGLRWRPLHKVQKHRPNRQVRRWVQLVALGGIMKKSLDIESKLFLALFVFCSGE